MVETFITEFQWEWVNGDAGGVSVCEMLAVTHSIFYEQEQHQQENSNNNNKKGKEKLKIEGRHRSD